MPGEAQQVAIAVVEHNDRFLIGRRPERAVLAGMWEFPGGKLLPGETLEECAVRECREESGIEVNVVGRFPDCVHEYDYGVLQLHFFRCRPSDPLPIAPRPPFSWIARSELSTLQFPPANTEVLQLLSVTSSREKR